VAGGRNNGRRRSADGAGADPGGKSTFFRRIQERALSPKQRAIGSYLTRHYHTAVSQTAAEIAVGVGTSEATVIRFATQLGYAGYPELKQHLHRMVREDLTSLELLARPLRADGKRRDTLTSVVQAEMQHLRTLAEWTSREDVTRLVKGLVVARRVYVVGHRASAPLAQFLGYTLGKIHEDVVTITTGASGAYDAFRTVPAPSWLIGIAFPRYPRETLDLMAFAREEGIVVAAITDSPLSPAARPANLVLPVESEPVSFVDAHCAPQALIATVLVEYGVRARERTAAGLGRFERLALRHAMFHTDD
jgi:DNA-binding MurR/RpiR family transcriptional regulator